MTSTPTNMQEETSAHDLPGISHLEKLPNEILQRIFLESYNANLTLVGRSLRTRLLTPFVQSSMVEMIFDPRFQLFAGPISSCVFGVVYSGERLGGEAFFAVITLFSQSWFDLSMVDLDVLKDWLDQVSHCQFHDFWLHGAMSKAKIDFLQLLLARRRTESGFVCYWWSLSWRVPSITEEALRTGCIPVLRMSCAMLDPMHWDLWRRQAIWETYQVDKRPDSQCEKQEWSAQDVRPANVDFKALMDDLRPAIRTDMDRPPSYFDDRHLKYCVERLEEWPVLHWFMIISMVWDVLRPRTWPRGYTSLEIYESMSQLPQEVELALTRLGLDRPKALKMNEMSWETWSRALHRDVR